MKGISSWVFTPGSCLSAEPTQGNKSCHCTWKAKCLQEKPKKSEWNTNILMGSEINIADKTQLQRETGFLFFFFLLKGQGRLEIVQCKQVKIEHTATLITLLADREVQLRPWEGNYSHKVWKADKRDVETERVGEQEKNARDKWKKDARVIAHGGERKQGKDGVILTAAYSDGQKDRRTDSWVRRGSSLIMFMQFTRHTLSQDNQGRGDRQRCMLPVRR